MSKSIVIAGMSLSGWELPEEINMGGEHKLAIHDYIGGKRHIDAMGPSPDPISWKARFRGPSAFARMQALDELRIAGAQVELIWFSVFKLCVIKKFKATVKQSYEIDYEITVEIITEDAGAGLGGLAGALDGLVSADMLSADNAAAAAPQGVSDAIAPIDSALASSSGLTFASKADLDAFTAVVQTASASLGAQAAALDASIDTSPGMLGGGDPEAMSTWLSAQLAAVQGESATLDTKPYIDRVAINVQGAGA